MTRVVVLGRDAALWLAAGVIQKALQASGITVTAVEMASALGPADACTTLPPLEALHNQLRVDEAVLIRTTRGGFTLGQNFADASGATPAFLHAYGSAGTAIDGKDFFAYWLKARRFGLPAGLEDFSLTAAAARHGRLMLPDDESEIYGRCDYGYHLPAQAYVRSLRALAIYHGVTVHAAEGADAILDPETGAITALQLDGGRIEGDLFIDATGPRGELIAALGVRRESWRAYFPADRMLAAAGPRLAAIPVYAEVRASETGWTGLFPTQAQTHVTHAYASALTSDEEAFRAATAAGGIALTGAGVRASDPGRRALAWERNCIAIGEAACAFDPVHGVDLHAIQLGLVHLLACFPASRNFAAERAEYNRVIHSAFERIRDFQSAHYVLNRYGRSPFWTRALQAQVSPDLAHRIATFAARGDVAPMEDESFSPDSWRALLIGHGLIPDSYLPTADRTPPEQMKAQFQRMLGFVKQQVLKQPTHDAYLAELDG